MILRRFVCSLVLSTLFLLPGVCGAADGQENTSKLRVMLIGVDGATWDVMAPMIDGISHEAAKETVPRNLLRDGGFESSSDPKKADAPWRIVETSHSGANAVLLVDDSPTRVETWQTPLNLKGITGDRLVVEGWIRHPEGHGTVTMVMKGARRLIPPRSFDVGPDWQRFRFQTQVPPAGSRLKFVIHPYDLPSSNIVSGTGSVLLDDLSVREIRRMRFPTGGFTHRRLNGPENRLPAVSRLIREGACGPLGTFNPNASPALWTTAATGKRPEAHGIHGFYFDYPGREEPALVNSTVRQVKALWNIVGQPGGDDQVTFVSWWATWPAETVNGLIVSDHANTASRQMLTASGYLTPEDLEQHEGNRGLTYPHPLMGEILPLMVPPETVTAEMVSEYAELTPADRRAIGTIHHMEREELSLLKFKLAAHLGTENVARHLYTTRDSRLFGVYFPIVDAMEHYFWRWLEPELFLHAPEERVAVFGETLERVYVLQDQTIQRFRQLADENTVIIIFSDHGHRPVRLDSEEGKSGGHSAADPGVILISGGPARAGAVIEGATLLDITPTVLYLLGYPVASDMPGRVLTEAFEDQYLAAHPVGQVRTYEGEAREVDRILTSDEDEKITEELRALGYIE